MDDLPIRQPPPTGQCSGDAAAVNAPVVPVASHAVAQDRGAGHNGALLPRPELNGSAALFPAPSCAPVVAPAAPASDEGPAPQPLPPTDLPAQASAPAPVPAPVLPVAAPLESLRAASQAPESFRDDPFAELSPGPSAAPLLHPQRQRELIEQAAGMSTRQVASLLAAAAPEVVPPPLPEGRTRSRCWPTLLHRVSQGPPHCWMVPAQVALNRARSPLPRPPLLRRRSSRPAPWRMAPMPAQACRARRSPLRRRSRYSACSPTADRAAPQPEQRRTRPANLFTAATNPRRGATFPQLSGATSRPITNLPVSRSSSTGPRDHRPA